MTNEKYKQINDLNLKSGDKVIQVDCYHKDHHATITKLEMEEKSIKIWHKHDNTLDCDICFWECDTYRPVSTVFKKLNESQYDRVKRMGKIK